MQPDTIKILAFLPKWAQGYTIDTLSQFFPFFNIFFIQIHKYKATEKKKNSIYVHRGNWKNI